ncbi:hypothetical protein AMS68_001263 [Peltaster fructicola]|uniref:Uncharacterized protein n=1 Tax=Peltaster fructicola TaxID=286661 RepID=A0A6H0XM13_9PEZI|nr:hypothetical protein AMS68_001263 [Peltaster fructicola]
MPDEFQTIDQRTQPQSISRPLPAVPDDQRPPMPMSRSSQSITRKPVPRKAVAEPRASSPSSEHGSFTNAYIDNDALEQILQDDARLNSMGSIASSATPDYASTRSGASKHGKQSMERPRMGKLKTVGDPDLLPVDKRPSKFDTYEADQQIAAAAVIPTIDFGPTYSYKPTARPDTAKTLMQGDRSRSHSRDRLSSYLGNSNKNSPGDTHRNSYFGNESNLTQPGNRNSIAWTPGAGGSPGPSSGLTPEQWVQYRAAVASQPQNAPRPSAPALSHSRQNSTTSITRKLTKTPPPFARTPSGDWSQLGRVTPPSRPDSRGAGTYLGRSSPGLQHSLSAAEQMHVARATGMPLLGLSNSPRQMQENAAPNLLDTVAMREREKAAVKDGMRTGMVEEAIRSRQQQQMQNNAEALRQHAVLAQQQQQHTAQAYQFQQNAYTASASPSVFQAQRQSWIQPQAYNQQLPPPQPMAGSSFESQQFSSPFAQRLYEGQQAQAFMAQQGQPNRRSPGPGYNR